MKKMTQADFKLREDNWEGENEIWGKKVAVNLVPFDDLEDEAESDLSEIDGQRVNEVLQEVEESKELVMAGLVKEIFPLRENKELSQEQFLQDMSLSDVVIYPEYGYRFELNFDINLVNEEYFGDHWVTVEFEDGKPVDYLIQG